MLTHLWAHYNQAYLQAFILQGSLCPQTLCAPVYNSAQVSYLKNEIVKCSGTIYLPLPDPHVEMVLIY